MLLKDRATKETMMDTDILAQIMGSCTTRMHNDILIDVGIYGTLRRRLETQVLQDTSAGAADPHIDKTTAKGKGTDDRGTNEGQAAAHDKWVQRWCTEDAVERGGAVLNRHAVIKDVAINVVDAVERGERDASAGAYKVEFCRARLAVVERDHDDTRDVRERGVD